MFDCLAANQKLVTMRAILTFFKAKNPQWQHIRFVVIDKGFVEWKVLEEAFPDAKVLLCQSHTISYWKKLVRRPKYGLDVTQRDVVVNFISQMINACVTTSSSADSVTEKVSV